MKGIILFFFKKKQDCLEWHPEESNRFHLVEKRSGRRVKTCYMSRYTHIPKYSFFKKIKINSNFIRDSFFFLNFASAREEGDSVVVDIVAYDSPDILDRVKIFF